MFSNMLFCLVLLELVHFQPLQILQSKVESLVLIMKKTLKVKKINALPLTDVDILAGRRTEMR